ncbi:MAG: Eco57I restriction-modification methylase domain-containing protein [Promethearchaeota archaeon]
MVASSVTRELGAIPTPQKIVSFIVLLLLKYWEDLGEPKSSIKNLNILDPAAGDGRFLMKFAYRFKEFSKSKGYNIDLHCHGLDINPKVIKLANDNILKVKDLSAEMSLKVGNTLLGYIAAPKGWDKTWSRNQLNSSFIINNHIEGIKILEDHNPFHWFVEWPKVSNHKGYDIILGNPPYGINFLDEEKLIYRNLYRAIDPEVESYILFIERSIQLLREGGIIGFIIPSNLVSNFRYQKIRQYLLDTTKILRIVHLDNRIFPGFHVETCILVLQRNSFQKEREKNEIHIERINTTLDPPIHPIKKHIVIQQKIKENLYNLLLPQPDEDIVLILEKIQENSIPLWKFTLISRGIEVGFHSAHTSNIKKDANFVPLIAGRSIKKFRLDKNIRYIRFDKHNKSIFKDYNLYLKPKLLLRRIGHELIAIFDPNQHFCVCDVYMITLRPNRPISDLIFLEALLNSSLMSFYLMQRFTSVKKIFPKIPIKYLKDLPIKIPSSITKIQNLLKNLHSLPWCIQHTDSHRLNFFKELDEEIFRIYSIKKDEQDLIYNLIYRNSSYLYC